MWRFSLRRPTLALMLAACSDSPVGTTSRSVSPDAHPAGAVKFWEANAAVYWDEIARALVAGNSSNPFQAIRGFAILGLAQYNAAVAAEQGTAGSTHPSVRAAISAASVVALSYLYPSQAAALEAQRDQYLADRAWPGWRNADAAAGEVTGRAIGAQVVARAQTDGFFAPWTGTVPTGPGIWFSSTPPIGAGFGAARTFLLLSGSQFRPPPPPAFGSPGFLAALAEVRQIADTRTPARDANAKFWNFPTGTYTPPGYWNEEATTLAVKYHLNERQTAHLLALMNMVSFDAVVASHEAKYFYWLLRPSMADPGITLSFPNPNFPAYPSNHASISAGMAAVLGATFPAEKARLDALAEEAALSRVLGGIHYRFDGDAGIALGRAAAAWALAHDVNGHEPFVPR